MTENIQLSYFKSLPQPFAVVGMGITGRSLVALLKALGVEASQIFCFDDKEPTSFGKPEDLLAKKPGTLFVSPGVPLSSLWIKSAQEQGIKISSELSLAFSLLTTERIIAVTGSVGKSTTTSILGAGAFALSSDCFVGGNLGTPLAIYATELLGGSRARAPWVILELSSYQLENFENFVCDYAAITYLTPNHLERYSELLDYYLVKLHLISRTKFACVMNSNGGDLTSTFESEKNRFLKKQVPLVQTYWVDRNSEVLILKNLLPCSLVGEYNKDNLAVAGELAALAGWPESSFLAMKNFSGLPHRLENLGVKNSIQFINDSKATTIESVIQAVETVLETLTKKSRLILLLGGHDKNLPWDRLKPMINYSQIVFVFFGEFGASAQAITGLPGPCFSTLAVALSELPKLAQPGDIVLLSPGGTSHDEFKNFEERGHLFKSEIKRFFGN